ncbi:hypothetical protein [Tenacibaculum aiptasiae]|uniref:hypothetical protein n=1 Tax=Tenacibaculum aiptasiae TaxID=426481 RepID=UPI00232B92A9|nr:hypothetical protein [Tenacibaculum aiptasiae]
MLKNISKLGTPLNKKEQKTINGGFRWSQCGRRMCCARFPNGEIFREPCYCDSWGHCTLL